MAARLVKILQGNSFAVRRILSSNHRIFARAASSGSSTVVPPPITPVSGPDWEEKEWKDDGFALHDYPNLPARSYQLRDPYATYWDQQDRRNFGEPLHEEDDALGIWMPDRYDEEPTSPIEALRNLCIAFGCLGFVYFLSTFYTDEKDNPAVPTIYPFNNLYLENGGDPNKDPSEQPVKRIPRSCYGY
eukprot:gene12729-14033_t